MENQTFAMVDTSSSLAINQDIKWTELVTIQPLRGFNPSLIHLSYPSVMGVP